jgi:hypothetical protein
LISTEKPKLWNEHKPKLPKTTRIEDEIQEPEVEPAVAEEEFPEPFEP